MAKRHMKRCSTSLIIKTTMKYHLTQVGVVVVKESINSKWSININSVEKWEPFYCWWGCKLVQPLNRVWRFFRKLELPYDPAVPLLGMYLEKTIIQKDTFIPVFIAVIFTIAIATSCVTWDTLSVILIVNDRGWVRTIFDPGEKQQQLYSTLRLGKGAFFIIASLTWSLAL